MLDLSLFRGKPSQRKVALFLFRRGIRVASDGGLYANDLSVAYSSVAKINSVDSRVVKSTVKAVLEDDKLRAVFERLRVGVDLREVAPELGFGVFMVIPEDASGRGIISQVTGALAKEGLGIRQVVADDPMFEDPQLTVVIEKRIPPKLIDVLLNLSCVKKIVVLN
ncbi:MAG: amino acid-binding protein [Candidatus Altiarchaeales archaeon]|nr:amino acid-binding protein [Candidatus Altiarchaeales archaeon]